MANTEKINTIKDAVRTIKNVQVNYRKLNFLRDLYNDNTWSVGGADEITQQDITDAGFNFAPNELKSALNDGSIAIDLFMNNGEPNVPHDWDKVFNLIIAGQE